MNELDIRWDSFQYHTEDKQSTFEELCRRLFTAKYLKNTVVPHTDPNLAGIEVQPVLEPARADGKPSQYISFQSKYTGSLSSAYTKFKESAEKTVKYFNGKLDRVYLFCNQSLSTASSQYKMIAKILDDVNMEAVLVCGTDLLDLIKEYPEIANDYFPAKSVRYSAKDRQNDNPVCNGQEDMSSLQKAKTVRKLSDNLWVNWKTGRLGTDIEFALYHEKGKNNLSAAELRLLSVLVQGEGAVVGWDELVQRGIKMQKEIDALKASSGSYEFRGETGDCDEAEALGSSAGSDSDRCIYLSEEEENNILKKANDYAKAIAARGIEIDLKKLKANVRLSISAIRKLCRREKALADIIKPAENGSGFRILVQSGIKSAEDYFPAVKGEYAENDWENLSINKFGYCETEGWLRRHYASVCGSFEGNISNAGGNLDDEAEVFGRYNMSEAHIKAYAKVKDSGESVTLLDFVEKWYRESREKLIETQRLGFDHGNQRVLIVHGQPGDGKTTFCKKAVYAHCFEGWLSEAPDVLRISLNKNENGGIINEDKLNLPKSISIKWSTTNHTMSCAPGKLKEGTLVIFDGYDELAGNLNGDKTASTFADFYNLVKRYARDRNWFVVITSRTMCIRRELEEKKESFRDARVVSFAPITTLQQELMIDRMIELDEMRGFLTDDLRTYQKIDFPNLRKNKELKEFLSIPILFRMIVAVKFKIKKTDEVGTLAELYGSLFDSLMHYHEQEGKDNTLTRLEEYENIASRIFNYNDDTCLLEDDDLKDNKKLVYLFLTKSGLDTKEEGGDQNQEETEDKDEEEEKNKEGQVGFLHRSFYQYFFARYLVSGIQKIKSENDKAEFLKLMKSLCARLIKEELIWQFIEELAYLKGKKSDPFYKWGAKQAVSSENITAVRNCLNDEMVFADCMAGFTEPVAGAKAEEIRWHRAENAVFNILGAISAIEKTKTAKKKNDYTYQNCEHICRLLRRGYFHNIYFEKANLSNCDLFRANFGDAKMKEAVLTGATLNYSNLSKASLEAADFQAADLTGANLAGAKLKRAHFEGATLEGTDFNEADLEEAFFDGEETILKGAKLINADLTGATLIGANLAGADLREAWLVGADLSGAHLEEALLDGAVLKDAKLVGAHLEQARIINAELCGADLTNAKLDGAILKGAHLDALSPGEDGSPKDKLSPEAVLNNTSFKGADVGGAYLSDTQYRKARESGAVGQPYRLIGEEHVIYGSRDEKALTIAPGMREVAFGRYPQGKNGEVLPLRWRVLAVKPKERQALLITEKLIDCRRYHKEFKAITWAECNLQKWLNNEFLKEAFTEQERGKINLTKNKNPDNKRYETNGGENTEDNVFLLSLDEAETYFRSDIDREAAGTDFAVKQGLCLLDNGMGWWWLRSPGSGGDFAACVIPDGRVFDFGYTVYLDIVGVRPALWLNL